MYVPGSFKIDDQSQIEAFVRRYDFATLVSSAGPELVATHLPLVLRRGPAGLVLVGHVARANSHRQMMDGRVEALAIFTGPHGFISPTWYATGPAVPTWNYAVVHAYGKPRVVPAGDFARGVLGELVLRYETGPEAWRLEDQPSDFAEQMLAAIVAFEMPVDRLEAKFKLGQNRSAEDRAGTIAGLTRESSPEAASLAALMRFGPTATEG
jgi:transcriptional regulator